ncbi:MAG: NAD-dependent epimerase/dehydratase family protein [Chloroflexi bacterium]|nr:MAG: NAD-dependent epimerase/dehydratase family protein [Chloroflexota bacterium]
MNTTKQRHAVTGAFGYSGKYITQRLLNKGHEVITLTNSLNRENPFGDRVQAYPFNFDNLAALTETLKGVDVLTNTYWVRFNHSLFQHADAVQNTLTLFEAAKAAGVSRIVHVSITNPSLDSNLEYFSGKATLEEALKNLGVSYAILRPTVLFGKEDILINNIAWLLRTFPVFGVFGDGRYRIQPIYVDDLAELAVTAAENRENEIINAIGPETFTYRELVETVGEIIGKKRPLLSIPPALGYLASRIVSMFVDDVLVTREEIDGLMADLLHVTTPATGTTHLTTWASRHAVDLGKQYTSELARRRDRSAAYASN